MGFEVSDEGNEDSVMNFLLFLFLFLALFLFSNFFLVYFFFYIFSISEFSDLIFSPKTKMKKKKKKEVGFEL